MAGRRAEQQVQPGANRPAQASAAYRVQRHVNVHVDAGHGDDGDDAPRYAPHPPAEIRSGDGGESSGHSHVARREPQSCSLGATNRDVFQNQAGAAAEDGGLHDFDDQPRGRAAGEQIARQTTALC